MAHTWGIAWPQPFSKCFTHINSFLNCFFFYLAAPSLSCSTQNGQPSLQQAESSSRSVLRAKIRQSCPTLCDPVAHSLPGSSVHGLL